MARQRTGRSGPSSTPVESRPRPSSARAARAGLGPDPVGGGTRPPAGVSYPESLRDTAATPGLPDSGLHGLSLVFAAIAGYLIVYLGGTHAVALAGWWSTGRQQAYSDFYALAVTRFASPWGIWAAHLGLGLLVVGAWAAYRFHHRRRLAWLWSVMPGVRWRYGVVCLAVALVVFGGYAALAFRRGAGWDAPGDWVWYLVPIIVSTPFQALGEEVLFRGYLMQALGLVWARPVWPILASAVLFAVFHGAQNPALFVSRLVFGLLAGALVWRTGGLEAGIAAHVANNLGAFGLALITGQLQGSRTVTELTWAAAFGDVALFAVFAALAWGIGAAMRLPRRVPAVVER